MAGAPLTGSRIRSYRIDKGLRQSDLAGRSGISGSYLNLIEHNRRNIGGALLVKIAHELDVEVDVLTGGSEAALMSSLDAAAEAHLQAGAERLRSEELAGRFPGWAQLIAAQQNEVRRLEHVVEQLGDRLTHDPFLSASMHSMLSSVTAIRSASAILANDGDVEPEWEARFHRNIFEDSQRLAQTTETLVQYLDDDVVQDKATTLPQDELDAWLTKINWHCAELEADPAADTDTILDREDTLRSTAARHMAGQILRRYGQDVAAIPKTDLLEAMSVTADPLQLAAMFKVDLPVLFRRLAVLRPDEVPEGTAMGLVSCDGSGTLMFRKPTAGFGLPRFSAACPLWPLFQALQRPMVPIVQTITMAGRDEASFDAFAISNMHYPEGLTGPAVVEAWMLIRPRTWSGEATHFKVGTSCRVCTMSNCVARREPSVIAPDDERSLTGSRP